MYFSTTEPWFSWHHNRPCKVSLPLRGLLPSQWCAAFEGRCERCGLDRKKWSHAWLWIPSWHFLEGNKTFIILGGGNSNICLFSFLLFWGNSLQFDEHIFQMGWFNHQLVIYNTNDYGTLLLDWNMFPKSTSVSEVLRRTNKNIMPLKIDLLAQKEWYCTAYNWLKIPKTQYFILQHSIGSEVSFWFFGINFTCWLPTNTFSDWPFP